MDIANILKNLKMVKIRCKNCGAIGRKFYTHGKKGGTKSSLVHHKDCNPRPTGKVRGNKKRK